MILLATLNARYSHTAFGLRYLHANLGELRARARIMEFTIGQNSRDIAEQLLELKPRIVGLGVYIWNTTQTLELVSILKRVSPETVIVLGGPEISHETESQPLFALADHVVRGEADVLFAELCRTILEGGARPPHLVSGPLPELASLASPYPFYSDEDIRNRVLYVEASRGCPYRCEYCLSSLDKSVRAFDLDRFLDEMDVLIRRGARQFKFVDRTFNLSVATSSRILRFFLDRGLERGLDQTLDPALDHDPERGAVRAHEPAGPGLFLHFEMVPDRLPEELRELIRRFPAGSLQFEVGIQTWNPEVAKLVSRRQDYARIIENFRFLTRETGVHLHADLIAGLPGETLDSFAAGFDAVAELEPQEIQLGILKRLKGTPITRHDAEWKMVYQEHPPFQVLSTRTMDFPTLQGLTRLQAHWDLFANSGNFPCLIRFLRERGRARSDRSWFREFLAFSHFLSGRHPQGRGIALQNLVESAWLYLTADLGVESARARAILVADYCEGATRRDMPAFLRETGMSGRVDRGPSRPAPRGSSAPAPRGAIPPRQARHRTREP